MVVRYFENKSKGTPTIRMVFDDEEECVSFFNSIEVRNEELDQTCEEHEKTCFRELSERLKKKVEKRPVEGETHPVAYINEEDFKLLFYAFLDLLGWTCATTKKMQP